MHEMTEKNIEAAFAGESMAHIKYLNFSQIAEKEGFSNTSRLFKAIAYAEFVHASNHMGVLGLKKKTSDNLVTAAGGENFEVNEMYPAYKVVADLQEEKSAQRSINFALQAEKIHEVMYLDTKKSIDQGKDIEIGPIFICDVCGHTVTDEAPDFCPVCGAKIDKFTKF